MATPITVCNQALLALGAQPIVSFEDNTTEAKLCKAHYGDARDAVLEAHNWTFATRWLELAPLDVTPPGEFDHAFPLDPNVLRVLFVGSDYNRPARWRREGMNIMTDDASGKAQVLWRETDLSRCSSLFAQALASRLAAEMAIALTNSRTIMETHFQVYQAKVAEAARIDNLQGSSRRIRSRWLGRYRYGLGPTV